MNRRNFLKRMGIGALVAAIAPSFLKRSAQAAPGPVPPLYDKKVLKRAEPHLQWRRYGEFQPRTEPLKEGEDITAKQVRLTIEEFNRHIKIQTGGDFE